MKLFSQEFWLSGALFVRGPECQDFAWSSGYQKLCQALLVRALFVRISGCQELCQSGALTVRTLSRALVIRSFVKLCCSEFLLSGALDDEGFVRCSVFQCSFCQKLWLSEGLRFVTSSICESSFIRSSYCHKHFWSRTMFVRKLVYQGLWMPGIFCHVH